MLDQCVVVDVIYRTVIPATFVGQITLCIVPVLSNEPNRSIIHISTVQARCDKGRSTCCKGNQMQECAGFTSQKRYFSMIYMRIIAENAHARPTPATQLESSSEINRDIFVLYIDLF